MVHGRALDIYSWTRLYEHTKKLTRLFVSGGAQNEAFGACLGTAPTRRGEGGRGRRPGLRLPTTPYPRDRGLSFRGARLT